MELPPNQEHKYPDMHKLYWLAAICAAVVGIYFHITGSVSASYDTFQTKEEAKGDKEQVYHRLDRMEDKIDILVKGRQKDEQEGF